MISLSINNKQYENDVRALLMAFFYGEKILLSAEGCQRQLSVCFEEKNVTAVYEADGQKLDRTGDFMADDYRESRNQVKRLVYGLLSEATGRTLPWGTLTGIRPTKLAMERYELGETEAEAAGYLQTHYLASPEKAALNAAVARNEKKIMDSLDFADTFSLYIGIPFCPSICAYCSFSSYPLSVWAKQVDAYLDALICEINEAAAMMAGKTMLSLYMGGGTPTSLTALQMDRLLTAVEAAFDLSKVREITIEAGRPDSITPDKLQVIKAHGIGRISINPQTMNQETLDLIGRRHSVDQVREAFHMARETGFDNINMDLIVGLPGETSAHMQRTIDEITALSPESMTVHCLALKRASFLNQNREQFPVAGPEEIGRMLEICAAGAEKIGAQPYYLYRQKNIAGNHENVGYARPGCEGLYNILIMEEVQSILALGAGASSKFVMKQPGGVRIERVENVKSVKDYIERIDEMIGRKRIFLERYINDLV